MQRTMRALASEADTASTFLPVPITVAGPGPAISSRTWSAILTSCCWYPPSAQPNESSRKRLAWYTASFERWAKFSSAAQRDISAVTVGLAVVCAVAMGDHVCVLAAVQGLSAKCYLLLLQILKGQIR